MFIPFLPLPLYRIVLYQVTLVQELVIAQVNLGSLFSKQNEFKISISFRQRPPLKKPGPSADFVKVRGGRYLKEILMMNSFSFEDKDPRFTSLKPGLALRTILYKGHASYLLIVKSLVQIVKRLSLNQSCDFSYIQSHNLKSGILTLYKSQLVIFNLVTNLVPHCIRRRLFSSSFV